MRQLTRVDSIQGLRGLAALLVVVTHSILTMIDKAGADASNSELAWMLGELGVCIFFVISGFIMTATMSNRFSVEGASVDFVWRRIVRIAPLYWLATIVYVTRLLSSGVEVSLAEVFLSVGFIPYENDSGRIAPIYGLGWTLNYEIFFYVLFAIALLFKRGIGLLALVAAIVLLVLLRIPYPGVEKPVLAVAFYYGRPIVLYFVGGVVLGVLRQLIVERSSLPRLTVAGAMGVSMAFVAVFVFFLYSSQSLNSIGGINVAFVIVVALCCSVCALTDAKSDGGIVRYYLMSIGDASYSIYLTHSFLMGPAATLWAHMGVPFGVQWFTLCMLIGSVLLGLATYRFVELPMLGYLQKLRLKTVPA